ncbi:DinB family protein, partial [Klebsiella pneumoniae]|uniref:DinB family protein n=1 Tax=Klebsiella pneumoniae TaxID=573 RepID=UPI003852CA29
ENELKASFTYKNLKGMLFSNEVWKTVHHVMNHSTYHRGQIVTMLRQLGVTQIPQSDYIAFIRG